MSGHEAAEPYSERAVFINCPYDEQYAPLFHATILTIAGLGFVPRSARDSEGQADPRIDRIARGLRACKYSIHDLSQYQSSGADQLPRFNMPLELGMALAMRYDGKRTGREHNWVALVPPGFVHQKYISDLAGFDPPTHDSTQRGVVRAISAWLRLQTDYASTAPSPQSIVKLLPRLNRSLSRARQKSLGLLTWPTILDCVDRVLGAIPVD